MRRRIALCALFLVSVFVPAVMQAIPAYPVKKKVTLADGNTVEVRLMGDEYMHYYGAEDGRAFRALSEGGFQLITDQEFSAMKVQAAEMRTVAQTRQQARIKGAQRASYNYSGKKKGLVILMNFKDNSFSYDDPQALFNDYFNQKNYTGHGMKGSVSDYFTAQSYGNFTLEFDVVGPFTTSMNMKAYGASGAQGHDNDPRSMIVEACRAADSQVNFKDYDWDGNGVVDQVFVIYAGYGESYGADPNTIWPHESQIATTLVLDGVNISTYACSCELSGTSGKNIAGVGVPAHEFSHCLGIMDHYDTQNSTNYGMGAWDLMCSGCYNDDSCSPAAYTAFERWSCGWLQPKELYKEKEIADMPALSEQPVAYILYNEGNANEYYMLENRQPLGFDAGLPGHGLLVTHVDYNGSAWSSNVINIDASHQRMKVVAADNSYNTTSVDMAGDVFPGTRKVTSLTDVTTPAATLYNANEDGCYLLHKAIERITEDQTKHTVSFLACRPDLAAPSLSLKSKAVGEFTVTWAADPAATGYDLYLEETPSKSADPSNALVLKESFAKAYSKSVGFADISSKLSTYLDNPGFTGSKLFTSPDYLRFGTSSANGYLQAPTQYAPTTGELTLVMKVSPVTEGTQCSGSITINTAAGGVEELSFSFSTAQTIVLHTTKAITSNYNFKISPTSRMNMQYLAWYDGKFTADELGLSDAKKVQGPRRIKTSEVSTTNNYYTFTNLEPTSTFEVKVRAKDSERKSAWSEALYVDFDASPIQAISAEEPTTVEGYYDLSGRLVTKPSRGFYILNGKKILRK